MPSRRSLGHAITLDPDDMSDRMKKPYGFFNKLAAEIARNTRS
jgi:hypothetical protein